jgi:DNA-binding response OmpR family regulator
VDICYNTLSYLPPRIIFVDDDADLALVIRAVFRMAGFEAYRTTSAEDCLKKLGELQNQVDVIAVNGKIAADRGKMLIVNIRHIDRNIKIFVLAERNEQENKTRVLDYGANEFVIKPISLETMVEKVNILLAEEALREKRAEGH